jgi:hypothetical protein
VLATGLVDVTEATRPRRLALTRDGGHAPLFCRRSLGAAIIAGIQQIFRHFLDGTGFEE